MYSSKELGSVGTKVVINFELFEYRYINQIACFASYGKDEHGNLVSFLTRHEELCRTQKLQGKIKKFGPDERHQNAVVTALNFVKIPK